MLKETIYKEIDKLQTLHGTDAYNIEVSRLYEQYKDDAEARKHMATYIMDGVTSVGKRLERLAISVQLEEIADIVSMSYIARNYFKKTKAWLYQRINANQVNGKPAQFSETEMQTLKVALNDISKKIGSVSACLH